MFHGTTKRNRYHVESIFRIIRFAYRVFTGFSSFGHGTMASTRSDDSLETEPSTRRVDAGGGGGGGDGGDGGGVAAPAEAAAPAAAAVAAVTANGLFQLQRNQTFVAMVTMQYQARTDMVRTSTRRCYRILLGFHRLRLDFSAPFQLCRCN